MAKVHYGRIPDPTSKSKIIVWIKAQIWFKDSFRSRPIIESYRKGICQHTHALSLFQKLLAFSFNYGHIQGKIPEWTTAVFEKFYGLFPGKRL